jgi:hypothetical protein
MRRIATIATLVLATPAASAADSFYATYIGERGGVAPCYARTYDQKHMAAHPKQRVKRFYVIHSSAEHLEPPATFEVILGYKLRGIDDYYVSEAGCGREGADIVCWAEGDAGSFKLAPNGEGLRITIDDRLHLEGRESFSPDLAKGGDDRVLLVHPSPPNECNFGGRGEDSPPEVDPLAPSISRPG